jgi:hypothetical protein
MKYPPGTLLWTPPITGVAAYDHELLADGKEGRQFYLDPNSPVIIIEQNAQMPTEAKCLTCMGVLFVDTNELSEEPYELLPLKK